MTDATFAADMGNMIGDGADLAPLMGTFSFSGRDPNRDDEHEETKASTRQSFAGTAALTKQDSFDRAALSISEQSRIADVSRETEVVRETVHSNSQHQQKEEEV